MKTELDKLSNDEIVSLYVQKYNDETIYKKLADFCLNESEVVNILRKYLIKEIPIPKNYPWYKNVSNDHVF